MRNMEASWAGIKKKQSFRREPFHQGGDTLDCTSSFCSFFLTIECLMVIFASLGRFVSSTSSEESKAESISKR